MSEHTVNSAPIVDRERSPLSSSGENRMTG
jgi:hypothetical protein